MQISENRNWIAITFVDRATELELKKAKTGNVTTNEPKGFSKVINYITDIYLNTQRYTHCEVAFASELPTSNNECMAFGVFNDVGVFSKLRTFSNPAYRTIMLNITVNERLRALEFCASQVGKPFDYTGMRMSPFWPKTPDNKTWFCIAFVMAVLHSIGVLKNYPCGSLDTDELVDILSNHPNAMSGTLPYHLATHIIPIQQTMFNNNRQFF